MSLIADLYYKTTSTNDSQLDVLIDTLVRHCDITHRPRLHVSYWLLAITIIEVPMSIQCRTVSMAMSQSRYQIFKNSITGPFLVY